ncbi:tyrosine-protein kinase receptor Tie-1-like isoform X1 [Anneissia japonica]|uniref:tyrosine-protein kinase receptor Tie-1-like isoform X1 n=1 Tax=Anneissia japonica TaxID=1529436 RepID=UPI00142555F4|nr:tyrosine-protein kinase receptor Tie-1-like isoform X1 [Anneissia japonica]
MDLHGNKRRQPVAIKTVKESATDAQRESFVNEIRIMISLGRFRNIVKLIGCCTLEYPYYVILEYMEHGDLHSFLRKCHQPQCQDPLYNLNDINKCNIARQVALGMEFLSLRRYYHGDLAARNILVGKELTVKISDFGLSTDIYTSGHGVLKDKQPRPILWASLETNLYGICTSKSDVWSFGVLLYEIYTYGAVPYPGILVTEVVAKLQNGYRMGKPMDCPEIIYTIMSNCWDAIPSNRRTFTQLVEVIDIYLEEFSQNDYMQLGSQENLTLQHTDKQPLSTPGPAIEESPFLSQREFV